MDPDEFKEHAIIPFIKMLETGNFSCYFAPTKTNEVFCGGLNLCLGILDMIDFCCFGFFYFILNFQGTIWDKLMIWV